MFNAGMTGLPNGCGPSALRVPEIETFSPGERLERNPIKWMPFFEKIELEQQMRIRIVFPQEMILIRRQVFTIPAPDRFRRI
ncbi:MAG: hypothetical protein ACFCUR_09475 [Rhodomicrobiaceae bacterium]